MACQALQRLLRVKGADHGQGELAEPGDLRQVVLGLFPHRLAVRVPVGPPVGALALRGDIVEDDHRTFRAPPVHVLALCGSADTGNTGGLKDEFAQVITAGLPLIVDLGALTFGDTTLLGLLLHAHTQRRLILIGPLSASFRQRLAITGADQLFETQPTLTRAFTTLTR